MPWTYLTPITRKFLRRKVRFFVQKVNFFLPKKEFSLRIIVPWRKGVQGPGGVTPMILLLKCLPGHLIDIDYRGWL